MLTPQNNTQISDIILFFVSFSYARERDKAVNSLSIFGLSTKYLFAMECFDVSNFNFKHERFSSLMEGEGERERESTS